MSKCESMRHEPQALRLAVILFALVGLALMSQVAFAAPKPGASGVEKPSGASPTVSITASVTASPTTGPCDVLVGRIVPSVSITNPFTVGVGGLSVDSATDLWAVGSLADAGQILHWDGSQWSSTYLGNLGPEVGNPVVNDVKAFTPTDVWIVGHAETFDELNSLIMHYDGHYWSINEPNPYGDNWLSASGNSTNDFWAAGADSDGHGIIGHWNGAGWSRWLMTGVSLAAIAEVSPTDVWVVGGSGLRSVATHWDGTSWTTVSTPDPGGSQSAVLRGASALSSNNVYAVGAAGVIHWNGTQWSTVPSPAIELYGVKAFSASNIWAVGAGVIMHWDGTNWIQYGFQGILREVDGVSANDLWAGGDALYRYDGSVWNRVRVTIWLDGNVLRGIDVFSPNDAWAVGDRNFRHDTEALIEHWNGTQWDSVSTSQEIYGSRLTGVAAASSNDIWAVGYQPLSAHNYNHVLTLIVHYDGTNWSQVQSPQLYETDSYLNSVAVVSVDDAWAVGSYGTGSSGGPFIVHKDASGWSTVYSPTVGVAASLSGVSAASANDVWAVGYYQPTSNAPLQTLTMHWDGVSWIQIPSPNVQTNLNKLQAVSALAPDDVWAVGYAGPVGHGQTLTMHWDGTQWSIVPSPVLGGGSFLFGVKAESTDNVWAVGNRVDSVSGAVQSLAVHWDGSSWQIEPTANVSGQNNYLYAVDGSSPNEMLGAGQYGNAGDSYTLAERFTPPTFSDVHATDYFYEAVQYLSCHGAISGYADGTFRPYNNTTRGQLSKIVVLAEGWTIDTTGGPHFSDVPTSNPFYDYIETAYNRHIISGYADGTFRWGNNVTRGQLCKIVVLAEGWQVVCPQQPDFTDVPVGDPFYCYIETAYQHHIISGYSDGTFRPGSNATRGQISKIVYLAITQP